MAEVYSEQSDYKNALIYREKETQIKDSLLNLKNLRYINELEAKYQAEKKDRENKLLLAESELHKRRSWLFMSLAVLLLVTVLLTFFILRQRTRSAQALADKNEQLYRKKINEIIKEQELKSINELMEGQENERKRIAEDLHDRLGSMLATIKLHFNAVEHKIESLELRSIEQYQKANQLLDQVCDEVRKIAHDMESGVLVNFGLLQALEELKDVLGQTSGLSITLTSYGMKERLGTDTEISIYRIIQELLGNVIKHANASEVNIDLNRTNEELTVMLSDNGKGFDLAEADKKGGMGLRNIRSRVARLNGHFFVDSGKQNGTTSIIKIPLQHDQYPHS